MKQRLLKNEKKKNQKYKKRKLENIIENVEQLNRNRLERTTLARPFYFYLNNQSIRLSFKIAHFNLRHNFMFYGSLIYRKQQKKNAI